MLDRRPELVTIDKGLKYGIKIRGWKSGEAKLLEEWLIAMTMTLGYGV